MEVALNGTIHLSMSEITKRMFNQKFLSDIQFTIDDKLIYAHSLELMKRSIIFQEHLEPTMGEKKLIPITDYKYESFYQFIRFCYTDECTINDNNALELMKLARNYRIIKLENKVVNFNSCLETVLLLFEYSVLEKYEGLRSHLEMNIAQKYSSCLRTETFLKLHPDAIEKLLRFDITSTMIRELEIFEALVRWMDHYCATNGIDLSQRRILFDKQIQLIRFPVIRIRDLRHCKIRYNDLLTKEDFMTIGSQVTFDYEIEERVWNSNLRKNFSLPVEWKSYPAKEKFESNFIVLTPYLLTGLRFGNAMRGLVEIQLKEKAKTGLQSIQPNVIKFKQEIVSEYPVNFLNMGEIFVLMPDHEYTIGINFVNDDEDLDEDEEVLALYRCEGARVICYDPLIGIKFTKISPNLVELMVKPIDDDNAVYEDAGGDEVEIVTYDENPNQVEPRKDETPNEFFLRTYDENPNQDEPRKDETPNEFFLRKEDENIDDLLEVVD